MSTLAATRSGRVSNDNEDMEKANDALATARSGSLAGETVEGKKKKHSGPVPKHGLRCLMEK
jgi:hypothetical protein